MIRILEFLFFSLTVTLVLGSCTNSDEIEAVELMQIELLKGEMTEIEAKIKETEKELEEIDKQIQQRRLNGDLP